jgi:hypothetical protein
MFICVAVLNAIRLVFDLVIALIEWVVETVCGWVSTILHFASEVCEEVCGWLGPFSFVCDWACTIVRWTETAWDWICEEVLKPIVVGFIRVVFEIIFYILTWVCWLLEWIPRAIDLLLCKLGFSNPRFVHLCIKVLTRDRNNPAWQPAKVQQLIDETAARLKQCNVHVCVIHQETIETDEHQSGIECGFSMLFGSDFYWFRNNECRGFGSIMPITVFFVEDIQGSKGCSVPGANFILADLEASNATIAHELGHLSDLWGHSDAPNNVMFSPSTDASVNFTGTQCCMIRSSKYVTTVTYHCLRLKRELAALASAATHAGSHAMTSSRGSSSPARQLMGPRPRPCGCGGR